MSREQMALQIARARANQTQDTFFVIERKGGLMALTRQEIRPTDQVVQRVTPTAAPPAPFGSR